MAAHPIVAVIGATGAQGGGVVDALLSSTKAHVRAITRNAGSAKAKEISSRGIEVVEADLGDKTSLTRAFRGAKFIFLVTDFDGGAKGDPALEIEHGKNAVDAAKESGVQHFIFSTAEHPAEDVRKALTPLSAFGGMVLPNFETKAAIQDYLKESGLSYTLLITCMFFENLVNYVTYERQPDGRFQFVDNMGLEPHAWHAVGDIGLTTAVVVGAPEKYKGETVPVMGELLSNPGIASVLSAVTGKTVKYRFMTDEEYAAQSDNQFLGLLHNMYKYFREFPYFDQGRPIEKRVAVGPSFKQWAEGHKEQLLQKLEYV